MDRREFIKASVALPFVPTTSQPSPTRKVRATHVRPAYKPRPDNHGRSDFQTSFIESMDEGVSFCLGDNGSGKTSAAMCKLARHVLYNPAPARDTPFLVIGPSCDCVTECCWKENLLGLGFIPEYVVDWKRVSWYNKTRGLPIKVPLLGHDARSNWCLEFHSVRSSVQRRYIGGFCFTDQWVLSL